VDAHLLADQRDPGGWPVGDILALAQFVNRDRRVMAMRDGPDDVLRPDAASPPKKIFGNVDCIVFG